MVRTLVFLTAAYAYASVAQGCASSARQSAASTAAAGSTDASTPAASAGQPAAPPPTMHIASMPATAAAAGGGGGMGEVTANASDVAGAGAAGSAGASGDGAAPSPGRERIPCDVAEVFKRQCHSCHGETLNLGAPMHLVTWSDLHAPAVSDSSKMVFELVAIRVQDTMRPMPPKMSGKLAVADRMLLVSWTDQGAPALSSDAADCP